MHERTPTRTPQRTPPVHRAHRNRVHHRHRLTIRRWCAGRTPHADPYPRRAPQSLQSPAAPHTLAEVKFCRIAVSRPCSDHLPCSRSSPAISPAPGLVLRLGPGACSMVLIAARSTSCENVRPIRAFGDASCWTECKAEPCWRSPLRGLEERPGTPAPAPAFASIACGFMCDPNTALLL